MIHISLPPELEHVRDAAKRAVAPIQPANQASRAAPNLLLTARDTEASRDLPRYYLVYFLLVDLLGFQNLGRFEKLDWSIPIDFEGVAYLIEYRKFGVGIFAGDGKDREEQAKRIAFLIKKGVKAATPYFKWMAERAIKDSKVNVRNVARELFERYTYFRDLHTETSAEAETSKRLYDANRYQWELPIHSYSVRESPTASPSELIAMFTLPWARVSQNSRWLALATIDAFFSWTEHIFIHLAILQGRVVTAEEVARLAVAEWNVKFKRALGIQDAVFRKYLDELLNMKRQLRNFVAHGAFGKEGEAFNFHSDAGAVPVALDDGPNKTGFSLSSGLAFNDHHALLIIDEFIAHLWSGKLEPAKFYIQESNLPLFLPMASDGRYSAAMASIESMKQLVDRLLRQSDAAANMDWPLMED